MPDPGKHYGELPCLSKSECKAHADCIREEIKIVSERADSLQRILPNLTHPETMRKVEQLVESLPAARTG
jgi:hypothetical protein